MCDGPPVVNCEFKTPELIHLTPRVTSEEVVGIIPARSLLVSTGYTKDNSMDQPLEDLQNRIYPCLDVYVGQQATNIDNLLSEQQSCALEVLICRALGPGPIGPGNSIQVSQGRGESGVLLREVWDEHADCSYFKDHGKSMKIISVRITSPRHRHRPYAIPPAPTNARDNTCMRLRQEKSCTCQ